MPSENGWEPLHPTANQLEWVTVPGTSVRLQFLKGQPLTILRAFAADFNAYVEPLRDADSAAYTATNSVATSNHLNGTAMDLNWNTHPFRVLNAGFSGAQIATIRELLAFYENTVWWGNDWNTPKDAMHWNMSYDTYGSEHVGRVQDFINRKIRADGFSTFRRSGTPPPPPPTPALSRADGYAVRIIAEGKRRGITPRGIQIALATALVESNITVYANAKVPASMALPHDAVGSDGFSVGIFQQQVRDTGNGWWWGDAATCMGVESSAGLFYDRLARRDYNAGDAGAHAQAVQQSAFPTRYAERFGEAVALYNRLAGTTSPGGDELTPEQDAMLRAVHRELTQKHPSRSPLRHLDDPYRDTGVGYGLNADGHGHLDRVKTLAELGHPDSLALLKEVASAKGNPKYPDRQDDADVATKILHNIYSSPAPVTEKVGPSAPAAARYAPSAAEVASAVAAVLPDTSQLEALYAENARLREENARLTAAVPPPGTTVAVQNGVEQTSGQSVGGVIDSVTKFAQHALAMNPVELAALNTGIETVAQIPNNLRSEK